MNNRFKSLRFIKNRQHTKQKWLYAEYLKISPTNQSQNKHVLAYRSGSVLTPMTGLSLSKTLLAARSIVPSPNTECETQPDLSYKAVLASFLKLTVLTTMPS